MIDVRDVAAVRAAEDEQFALLADGVLMQRASFALAVATAGVLRSVRGSLVGSRVVLLVGAGNNGGDALWAGTRLAERGCRVDALLVADRWHDEGAAALQRAGGRLMVWSAEDASAGDLLDRADVVLDGILGIGGSGGLRPAAAALAAKVATSGAIVIGVDVPSGVDADSGIVAGDAVQADLTVTFGALKPGLLIAPGSQRAGTVRLVDIGLEFPEPAGMRVLEAVDVALWFPEPAEDAFKYRRGVVGVAAGSAAYPGAALLATAAARSANVGMVRYLDRRDGVAADVVSHYPDVVVDGTAPAEQSRAGAWACGPGFTGDASDVPTVRAVLAARVPVVLDAGALGVLAADPDVRADVRARHEAGLVTVVTPHEGEFARLMPGALERGRLAAAVSGARDLGAIVVLKGPGTVIADPDGRVIVDVEGTSDLGTAGSGDVLTGLVGAVLSGASFAAGPDPDLLEAVGAAVWLHGAAGRIAAERAPVTAPQVADAVPAAIRLARFGSLSLSDAEDR